MKNCYTGSKEIADFDKKKQELAKKVSKSSFLRSSKVRLFPKEN